MYLVRGIVFIITAMSVLFLTKGCRSIYIIKDITGYRCSPNEDISLKQLVDVKWEQCRWQCLRYNNCTAVTYDAGSMECTLYGNMCTNMSQANSDVRTLILERNWGYPYWLCGGAVDHWFSNDSCKIRTSNPLYNDLWRPGSEHRNSRVFVCSSQMSCSVGNLDQLVGKWFANRRYSRGSSWEWNAAVCS